MLCNKLRQKLPQHYSDDPPHSPPQRKFILQRSVGLTSLVGQKKQKSLSGGEWIHDVNRSAVHNVFEIYSYVTILTSSWWHFPLPSNTISSCEKESTITEKMAACTFSQDALTSTLIHYLYSISTLYSIFSVIVDSGIRNPAKVNYQ